MAIEENLKLVNPMMSYIHNIPQLHTIPFEHFEHVRLVRPVCTVKRDEAIPRVSYLIVFIHCNLCSNHYGFLLLQSI